MQAQAQTATTPSLLPGFDQPVDDAQQVFRAALDAFARPGTVQALPATSGLPQGLSPASAALLLTLADVDTPVWLPTDTSQAARAFLKFHCGCPIVDDVASATFVCVPAGHAMPPLAACRQGDPAFPDRSATLIMEVASLSTGASFVLHGPGIETTQALLADGLPQDFRAQWRDNHAGFPLGVDMLLCAGDRFCALPRTTQLED